MAYAGDYSASAGSYNVGKKILDGSVTLIRYFSCATHNLTGSGVYKLFAVPANFVLLEARVICDTIEGGTATIDIVDNDSSSTVFVNDFSLETANAIGVTAARKKYAAAGFICVVPNEDLDTAVFTVTVKGIITNTSM